MASTDFFWFLARSMDLLKEEAYDNYARVAEELNGLVASVFCNYNRTVYFDKMKLIICDDIIPIHVETSFNDHTIIRLIDGKCSFLDTVLSENLTLRGKVEVIYKLNIAMNAFLNGALRSPGFLPLLSEYRRSLQGG